MSSQRLSTDARACSQTPLGVYGVSAPIADMRATFVCFAGPNHLACQAEYLPEDWRVVEIEIATGLVTPIGGPANWVRADGETVLWSAGGGVMVRWRRGGAAEFFGGSDYAYPMDVEGGRCVVADSEKRKLTIWNEGAGSTRITTTIALVGGGLTSDDWDGPGANLIGDLILARTDRHHLYSATTGAEIQIVVNPNANYAIPIMLGDGVLRLIERSDRLTIRGARSKLGLELVGPVSDFFGINARPVVDSAMLFYLTYWAHINFTGWSGSLLFDLNGATLVDVVSPPPPPPIDVTTPFPQLRERAWMMFWKTDTPDDNYGRVESPCNAILIEGVATNPGDPPRPPRPYDPALHGQQAILGGGDDVPPWNGTTGLVTIADGCEAGAFDLDEIAAKRRDAIARKLPHWIYADGFTWATNPDRVAAIEALREPNDGWELWLVDELYPSQNEPKEARYGRWRSTLTWHRDRFRRLGRRWGIDVSCYPQARPGADGFPVPGVGYPIAQIREDQRVLASLLAELGEGLVLVQVFSDLRYGGMSWTYPDGSRPLEPFRALWANANPLGPNPAILLKQRPDTVLPIPPIDPDPEPIPPIEGDDDMALLSTRAIITGEIHSAYQVGRGRDATDGDVAFQLSRLLGFQPIGQPGPREVWPPDRIFHDILAGVWPNQPPPHFPNLTREQCVGKTVAEIVQSTLAP
jgi:hypothetical protein